MQKENGSFPRRSFLKFGLITASSVVLPSCVSGKEDDIPDPTAVVERVNQLRTELIFNTPETGKYNHEVLKKWQEIEPQPKIDSRIGIAILPSKYVRGYIKGEGTIDWHTNVATKLGFQRVAVPISPPEFEEHTGIDLGSRKTLDTLIQYKEFDTLFSRPDIKAIHITCDVGGLEAASGWQFPVDGAFEKDDLQATYDEYRRTADYLLENYGHLGKEITIGGPNEMELLAKGGFNQNTEGKDLTKTAFDNMVSYYNTIHQAIRDANVANPNKTPLLTGAEVLQIKNEIGEGDPLTGLDVVQSLDIIPDELTLSAWQFSGKGEGGYWLEKAIEEMKTNDLSKSVAISEYGVADSDRLDLSREQIANYYINDIKGAFSGGAKYVICWGLTGYNSDNINPDNDEMRGLGLIRPDGSLRKEVYNAIRQLSNIETV